MKDMLGNEVKEGDYFAYPLVSGRSANMAIYQFKEVVNDKVRAKPIERVYGHYHDGIHPTLNIPWKYVDYEVVNNNYTPVEMTQAAKGKVDLKRANKRSTLQMFSERAILLKNFNETP